MCWWFKEQPVRVWDGWGGPKPSEWMIVSSTWHSLRTHHLHRGSFLAISPPDVKWIKCIWLEFLGDSSFSGFSFLLFPFLPSPPPPTPRFYLYFYFLHSHTLSPNGAWSCSMMEVQRRSSWELPVLELGAELFSQEPAAFCGKPGPVTRVFLSSTIQQSGLPWL